MNTSKEVAGVLRSSLVAVGLTQAELRAQAGVSQRTLTNVLSGTEDFKFSTLVALADRLGLELLLVPKGAAVAVDAGQTALPQVKSRVAAALEAVRPRGGDER
jgi:transcriptional regulator with XRE-family HTH domain